MSPSLERTIQVVWPQAHRWWFLFGAQAVVAEQEDRDDLELLLGIVLIQEIWEREARYANHDR